MYCVNILLPRRRMVMGGLYRIGGLERILCNCFTSVHQKWTSSSSLMPLMLYGDAILYDTFILVFVCVYFVSRYLLHENYMSYCAQPFVPTLILANIYTPTILYMCVYEEVVCVQTVVLKQTCLL